MAVEQQALTGLKARELMFSVYQKRLDTFAQQLGSIRATWGKIEATLGLEDDEEEIRKFASAFVGTAYGIALQFPGYLEELERDLAEVNLRERFSQAVTFLRDKMNEDFSAKIANDPVNALREIYKAVAYFTSMQEAIIEARAKELFQEYHPKSNVTITSPAN